MKLFDDGVRLKKNLEAVHRKSKEILMVDSRTTSKVAIAIFPEETYTYLNKNHCREWVVSSNGGELINEYNSFFNKTGVIKNV